jgi:hypothetical protein
MIAATPTTTGKIETRLNTIWSLSGEDHSITPESERPPVLEAGANV